MQPMSADARAARHEPLTILDLVPFVFSREAGPVDQAEQVLLPLEEHNAVVVLPSDANGHHAILELERAGVDGSHISYLRLTAPHVGPDDERGDDSAVAARDARALNDVGTGLLIGAVVGALVGAVLAFAVVAMIETVRAGAWAALGGAALGGSLGALWGTFGRLGASPAWERSYAQLGGSAMVVGVHTVDTKTYERALAVLERYGVWVFDRAGRVIRRP